MRKRFLFCISLLLLTAVACEKETERMEDYVADFATVVRENDAVKFLLDNNRLLTPSPPSDYTGKDGQRVVISYTPLQGDSVKIRQVGAIFTDGIRPDGYPERWAHDPVKIQSIWVGGGYLNMILEVEYHSKSHVIALLRDPSSETNDLYFSHSRADDPAGYPKKMYASFRLSELRTAGHEEEAVPFRLIIYTDEGLRTMEFVLPSE